MRTAIGACALLVTVAFVTGCDTDQPLQIDGQNVDVTISAGGALVPAYDTWTIFEDKNGNSVADDDYDGDGTADQFIYCRVPSSGRTTSATSVPWEFSFEMKIIREGGEAAEAVTSPGARNGAGNLPQYDTAAGTGQFRAPITVTHPAGSCENNAAITCDPTDTPNFACFANDAGDCVADPGGGQVTRTFVFTNGRKLSEANREVLASVTNPLFELEPELTCPLANAGICITTGSTATGLGTCSRDSSITCDTSAYSFCPGFGDFGDPAIDGDVQPYSLTIGNGDTIVVTARRGTDGPLGFPFLSEPGLSASFRVDGQIVNVDGSTQASSSDPTDSIDFFFTAR